MAVGDASRAGGQPVQPQPETPRPESKPPAEGGQRTEGSSSQPPPSADHSAPPPTATLPQGQMDIGRMFDSTMQAQADLAQSVSIDNVYDTQHIDKQETIKQAEKERPADQERARSETAEKVFMMKDQDLQSTRQKIFKELLQNQSKGEQWYSKQHQKAQASNTRGAEGRDDPSLKQQFFKVRSQVSPGLAKELADAKQMQFKHQMPPGYNAFMQNTPRGRQLFIYTTQTLKGTFEGEMKEGQLLQGDKAAKTANKQGVKPQHLTQAAMAALKQMAKQMGMKEGSKEMEEFLREGLLSEEGGEGSEEVQEGNKDPMEALRRAMGAKASKAKGKGEGEEQVEEDHPWANFGEAIEQHTVLFASADHAESAELVAQANFAGAIIMGAAIHIRLKGAKLNYSGTSHHGLPIPSGDEAIEMGAKELVAGFERDMGQLGVESVFVNGQRFELANKDDERKLRELVKDNPDLWQMIEDIREAIKESRYYRTCMGLMEEGPGGRA